MEKGKELQHRQKISASREDFEFLVSKVEKKGEEQTDAISKLGYQCLFDGLSPSRSARHRISFQ